jgi:Ca2+-binding RTX toxin-like protein
MATFKSDLTAANPTNHSDFLFGSNDDDTIFARSGADTIFAQDGNDEVYGESNDDTLHGALGDDYLNGGSGDDILFGEDGADVLDGSTNDDVLSGGGEDDFLLGGPGVDEIDGGGENDIISWSEGDGSDTVNGGGDTDFLTLFTKDEFGDASLAGERFTLQSDGAEALLQRTSEDPFSQQITNVEHIELYTAGGADSLAIGDLTGTGVESILMFGGEGTERVGSLGFTPLTIYGEGGGDILGGGLGDDTLFGGTEGDILSGSDGNDYLDGEEGDDRLSGDAGNDIIYGGDGVDGLVGGEGNDELIGGEGGDQFRYDLLPSGSGQDVIQDFELLSDDLFLGGVTQAGLDSNGDNLISDADDAVGLVGTDLVIDFGSNNSLTLNGVPFLSINEDVFFV